jgi:hypothetical protein
LAIIMWTFVPVWRYVPPIFVQLVSMEDTNWGEDTRIFGASAALVMKLKAASWPAVLRWRILHAMDPTVWAIGVTK